MSFDYDVVKEKKILSRYATYLDVLKRIGSLRLSRKITINDLGDKKEVKAITQRCYRDMEDDPNMLVLTTIPKITAIEYLCLVSYQYLIYLTLKDFFDKKGKLKLSDRNSALKLLKDMGIIFQGNSKEKKELESVAARQIIFLNICMKNRFDTKNMIRGFYKNEHLFVFSQVMSLFSWELFSNSKLSRFAFFKLLNVLHFYEFEMDKNKMVREGIEEEFYQEEDFHYWDIYFQQMVENMVITKTIEEIL